MNLAPWTMRSWGLVVLGGIACVMPGGAASPGMPTAAGETRVERRVVEGREAPRLPELAPGDEESSSPASPLHAILLSLVAIQAPAATQPAAAAPFAYRAGPQGFGYDASPAPRAAAARPSTAASSRPRTVGPGARNWGTGNRVPLHRPWMRARN